MKESVIQKLLRLYPAKWRNEYGAELQDLLHREPLRLTVVLNVASSALRQQLRLSNHPAGLAGALARMTAGVAAIFVLSMILSPPLWRLISVPMAKSLSQSGLPSRLIQNKPFENVPLPYTRFYLAQPGAHCAIPDFAAGRPKQKRSARSCSPKSRRIDSMLKCVAPDSI
jgi:hypothetical protein